MEENEGKEISEKDSKTIKEKRIRNLTNLYYSRKDVQKAIFEFSSSFNSPFLASA